MIVSFGVASFRSFSNDVTLPIRPVTCIVGKNSSGKSSLIHALLLMRQSFEQRVVGARVPQLNLSGQLVDAGTYEDLVFSHDSSLPVEFTFSVDTDYSTPYYARPRQSSLVRLYVPRPAPDSPSRGRSHVTDSGSGKRKVVEISMSFLPEPPFGPTLSKFDVDVSGVGRASFVRTTGKERVQHWRVYVETLPAKSLGLRFYSGGVFPDIVEREHRKLDRSARRRLTLFLTCAQHALHDLGLFLMDLKVVGPFRTPPARRYSFSGFGALDAGLSGERAVDLLIAEKLTSPSSPHLHKAVSFWLRRLGLAKSLNLKALAKKSSIFELLVAGAGYKGRANFADVGFGISQVLPVLVQAFFVRRGGVYIVQQPELHLHPDAQAALADFFIYLSSQGVTTIVETHSEYLLLRLRRRMAEKYVPPSIGLPGELSGRVFTPKSASIVLVEHDAGSSSLRNLEVGDSFQFENMPPGFMDQSVTDRLALMRSLVTRRA